MTRAFYLLPRLTIDRPLAVGAARVLPAGTAGRELGEAVTRAVSHDSARAAQQAVAALLESWSEHAVLEVPVTEDPGDRVTSHAHASAALETMAVLRFFVRRLLRVNIEAHRFGLEGETIDGLRDFIVFWNVPERDAPLTAPGWSAVASRTPLHVGAPWLDDLAADPVFAFVSGQLSAAPSARPVTGRRALTALALVGTMPTRS
jgi:hypothetical protein